MKSKNYIIPVIAAVACLTGCSTNYEATDVRRVSHDMQDRQFGGKNIQFDAIVSGIYGDGVTLTSLDGQVMTSGRIQRKLRTTVDTLSRGDKVQAASGESLKLWWRMVA